MAKHGYRKNKRANRFSRGHQFNKIWGSLPRAIEPDDVRQLIRAIDKDRDRAMILMLLRTGIRIGELLNTKVTDIHLSNQQVMILESGKNRAGRVVYFSDDAKLALEAWFSERDPWKEYVFYAQGRNELSYGGAQRIFKRCLSKAALSHTNYTLHCLRHTFASELLNAGMQLESLQKLMGHSSIETTRRYARLTDKTLEKEYFQAMSKIERGQIDGHYRYDF